jgi:hypothetical protein
MKFINLGTLMIILLSAISAFGQTTGKQTIGMIKESPAGMKTLRFIKAVNKDLPVDDKFVTTNFTSSIIEKVGGAEKLIAMLEKEIPTNDGVLTVYSVNRPTTFKYEYIAKGSKSSWLKIIFHMNNQNPYGIKGFELELIDKPDAIGEAMEL